MDTNGVRIGTYHLTEDTAFSIPQTYAGATVMITVPAGNYPVYGKIPGSLEYFCSVDMAGTITVDRFVNRLGSASRVSDGTTPRPGTYKHFLYDYEVAALAVAGTVTLERGFTTTARAYKGSLFDPATKAYIADVAVRRQLHYPDRD